MLRLTKFPEFYTGPLSTAATAKWKCFETNLDDDSTRMILQGRNQELFAN